MTATQGPEPYSILITDDDSGCRDALRAIVEPEGFRTILAESGEEALDIVRVERVHLALFDMHMPRLTGLETLEMVRTINTGLPCILVPADADEVIIRQALIAWAFSIITKPVIKQA